MRRMSTAHIFHLISFCFFFYFSFPILILLFQKSKLYSYTKKTKFWYTATRKITTALWYTATETKRSQQKKTKEPDKKIKTKI
jgi:hypothetical protein